MADNLIGLSHSHTIIIFRILIARKNRVTIELKLRLLRPKVIIKHRIGIQIVLRLWRIDQQILCLYGGVDINEPIIVKQRLVELIYSSG